MASSKRNASPRRGRLEQIKKVAGKLFYERGYASTDLRLIAEEVGLHVSSFYNYIESKEELLYLICQDSAKIHTKMLERALDGVTDPVERLRRAIRAHVLVQARSRYVSWASLSEVRLLTGTYAADIYQQMAEYEALWTELLEQGIATGRLRPVDVKLAVYGMLTMMQGVARWFNPRGRVAAEGVADLYADILLRGFCADGQPPRTTGAAPSVMPAAIPRSLADG
jgi:AcrR family transcriptional regulator